MYVSATLLSLRKGIYMYTYVRQIFVLLPTFLVVQSTFRPYVCTDTRQVQYQPSCTLSREPRAAASSPEPFDAYPGCPIKTLFYAQYVYTSYNSVMSVLYMRVLTIRGR